MPSVLAMASLSASLAAMVWPRLRSYGVLFVVAGANQVAGVTLFDQLGDRAAGQNRVVVGMRRDRGQHFARMRLAALRRVRS